MNTVADVLRAARALIDTPEKWGKGPGTTRTCGPDVWCAGVALQRANEENGGSGNGQAHALFSRVNAVDHIPTWNDAPERTHADVMAAFDAAIALAEAEGA